MYYIQTFVMPNRHYHLQLTFTLATSPENKTTSYWCTRYTADSTLTVSLKLRIFSPQMSIANVNSHNYSYEPIP